MKKILLLINLLFYISIEAQHINMNFISQNKSGCGQTGFHNSYCGHTSSEMVFAFYSNRQPNQSNAWDYNTLMLDNIGANVMYCANTTSNYTCGTGTPNPFALVWLAQQKGFEAKWYKVKQIAQAIQVDK